MEGKGERWLIVGLLLGYTAIFNLLDYSTCILPVTTVDKGTDVVDEGYEPLNEQDERVYKSCKLCTSFCSSCLTSRRVIGSGNDN